jgi:hypothetical protein
MKAKVIPFEPPQPAEPKCSFCGTEKAKAKAMVATETAAICDKCLAQATKRLEDTE